MGNWSADHQVTTPRFDRVARRDHSALVPLDAAGGANAGRHQDKRIAATASQIDRFARRTNNPVESAITHGGKLDVLVSNAGNMLRGDIDTLKENPLVDIFKTNVIAGMLLTGLCKPHLAKQGGAIIFIGSIHTRRAFPGASAYAATKGALETLTRVLAAELGEKGIRVNCVVPGAILTEIYQRAGLLNDAESAERLNSLASSHALGRIGTNTEIAEAVDYLARSEWTTGAILDVDGGLGLGLTHDTGVSTD